MSYYSKPLAELTPAEREETMRRSQELRRRIDEGSRPMAPDHDLTWENTNFKDFDNE
uniref:Uncharacterized protein n=1 Tax=Pseudomonas phage Nican01 TaxID=3138540 RepID=A0AAU6W114_9CAUD